MAELLGLMMRKIKKIKIKSLFLAIFCGCATVTLITYVVIHYITHDEPLFTTILRREVKRDKIKTQMQQSDVGFVDPINDIYLSRDGSLLFYHLPVVRRMSVAQFTEVTSANRDTSYPLAPDFTFHVDYSESSVVLYESFTPGCVVRVYLFPVLPMEAMDLHKMSADNLRDTYISLDIDGDTFQYTLAQLLEGKQYPFLHPISATHRYPASGLASHLPICYQKHMKVTYIPNVQLPRQLLHTTVNCSSNDLRCPIHIYSGISRTSFPIGTKVNSFKSVEDTVSKKWRYEALVQGLAEALKSPEHNGPDKDLPCKLQCAPFCPGCKRIIYKHNPGTGTIGGIKMRVFKRAYDHPFLLQDWNDILITAIFDDDGVDNPQINKVPLGSLFGVTGSLNDFSGAAMGHKQKKCGYHKHIYNSETDFDTTDNFPEEAMTGYFYFPMPYWKHAQFEIEGTKETSDKTVICYQFDHTDMLYDSESAGYFHAEKTYYTDDVSGWREMVKLDNFQGHIVAVLMDVDNLKAVRNVPLNERWATLQADPVLYVDDRKEASMIGTGLEDYFSYAHGFALAENTTYAFVGNYHAAPKRKEPLTWHAYRLHLFDPIPFHKSVHFIMEGTHRHEFYKPVKSIPYFQYRKRLANEKTGLNHMIFYYGKKGSNFVSQDSIQISDVTSERDHSFVMENPAAPFLRGAFHIYNKKYLGQCTNDVTHNKTGRHFKPGDKFSFQLRYDPSYSHLLLRREFYSPKFVWKQRAKLWVNQHFHRFWYISMGTVNEEFSLREDDVILLSDLNALYNSNEGCDRQNCDEVLDENSNIVGSKSKNMSNSNVKAESRESKGVLHIELEIETDWRDVAYYLYAFNKKV